MSSTNKKDAQKFGAPISRYSKFQKPKGFEKELETIYKNATYREDQNYHIIPSDPKACKQPEFDEDFQMFSMQVEAHRIALGMKKEDPVVILRSSLGLRDLYSLTVEFATNPVIFMETPLDVLPSLEQQLFEDRLIYTVTHMHPFLTLVYSTAHSEFFLLFNVPIPTDLNRRHGETTPDGKQPEPATLAYLRPCLTQVQQLSRYYPKASRPIVVTNSFPERVSAGGHSELGPLNWSCSNLHCTKTSLSNPDTEFKRCTACKQVMYCSRGMLPLSPSPSLYFLYFRCFLYSSSASSSSFLFRMPASGLGASQTFLPSA